MICCLLGELQENEWEGFVWLVVCGTGKEVPMLEDGDESNKLCFEGNAGCG